MTSARLWISEFNTEQLVYQDHPRDQQNVVIIHRWALYSSPSILQPFILRPPLIIRPLDLVPKGNFLC